MSLKRTTFCFISRKVDKMSLTASWRGVIGAYRCLNIPVLLECSMEVILSIARRSSSTLWWLMVVVMLFLDVLLLSSSADSNDTTGILSFSPRASIGSDCLRACALLRWSWRHLCSRLTLYDVSCLSIEGECRMMGMMAHPEKFGSDMTSIQYRTLSSMSRMMVFSLFLSSVRCSGLYSSYESSSSSESSSWNPLLLLLVASLIIRLSLWFWMARSHTIMYKESGEKNNDCKDWKVSLH